MAVVSNPGKLLAITGVNVFVGDLIRHVTTVDDQLDKITERYANYIARDAKMLVSAKTSGSGVLHDSITARRHPNEKHAWLVGPEIPPAYHAHLVEYGVPSRGIAPQPFMAPALAKWEQRYFIACAGVAGAV